MTPTVTVAVVGCGYLGSIHARLWKQCERATLVGVYDIVAERAQKLAAELGVAAFGSLAETLDACEAITIATTTSEHANVACTALAQGKHVLLEKPVAATLDEAERIEALAAMAGTIVHVGHVERYNPAFRAALAYVSRPLFIEVHRLSPFRERGTDISVIGDLMVHDLDLVLALVREPVIRIEAHGVSVVSNSVDIASARLEFAGGCIANLTVSRLTPKPLRKLRLFQPMAYMSLDFSVPDLEVYRIRNGHAAAGGDVSRDLASMIIHEHPSIEPSNAIADEHRAFVASILDGAPAVVSLHDGIAALRLAIAIEHDIKQRMEQRAFHQ